ncbi:MAG: hypothetical protein HYZ01_08140 [Ignavibacteriales bacterium]|nr:hypothetical protein [Ignavibacteriales bacterium]
MVLVATVLGALFTVVPFWFIFRKAGFHPALSLLMMVPVVSVVMTFFLALVEWPSLKKSDGFTGR